MAIHLRRAGIIYTDYHDRSAAPGFSPNRLARSATVLAGADMPLFTGTIATTIGRCRFVTSPDLALQGLGLTSTRGLLHN